MKTKRNRFFSCFCHVLSEHGTFSELGTEFKEKVMGIFFLMSVITEGQGH